MLSSGCLKTARRKEVILNKKTDISIKTCPWSPPLSRTESKVPRLVLGCSRNITARFKREGRPDPHTQTHTQNNIDRLNFPLFLKLFLKMYMGNTMKIKISGKKQKKETRKKKITITLQFLKHGMISCALSYLGAKKDCTHLQTQGTQENSVSTCDSHSSGTCSRKPSPEKTVREFRG